MLVLENDYIHELKIENGMPKTTQKKDLGHGYGLINVKECVEKNGGTILFCTDNYRFKVMISMINAKEELL